MKDTQHSVARLSQFTDNRTLLSSGSSRLWLKSLIWAQMWRWISGTTMSQTVKGAFYFSECISEAPQQLLKETS